MTTYYYHDSILDVGRTHRDEPEQRQTKSNDMKTKIRPNAIVLLDTEGHRWTFDCVTFRGATVTGHYTMHDGRHMKIEFPFFMVATILASKYQTEEYRSDPEPDATWHTPAPLVIQGTFARMNCDINRTPAN